MVPELPEVETVRRTLSELVINETIEDVDITWPKIIKYPDDAQQFKVRIEGQTFRSISRRGKFLIFYLDDYALISHLRMEGRYGVYSSEEEVHKHVHVRFRLKSGDELRYQDVRKFGTMHLFPIGTELARLPLSQLGPEPLSNDFTMEALSEKLNKTTRAIKSTLLDQKVVVGLGNIYVDEALFHASIHPETFAESLTMEETTTLYHSIKKILHEAVELGGSSIKSYVDGQGEMGMFQQNLAVYGRKGQPCPTCGEMIVRTVVGGRGTHACLKCQQRKEKK